VSPRTAATEPPSRVAWWWIAIPVAFTLATALVVDLIGSAAVRQIRVQGAARALLEAEVQQEPYRGTSWGRDYWEAIERYQEAWEPYYTYRVGTMATEFINVSDGVRATHPGKTRISEPNRLVLVFGGSAAWGHGARDQGTIPSWLSRVAEEQGERLDVRNYAESGWVNWQGITYLLQTLADGERPDTVVFYSGVNEILSGRLWPQVRRPIWNAEAVPRAMTDWALERSRPLARVWDYYRGTSYLWSLLAPRPPVLPDAPPAGRPELAARLAEEFLADRDVVERLGRAYGFRSVFVWQLSVADKPSLSAQERRYAGWLPRTGDTTPAIDWWAMDTELKHLHGEVGRLVKARGVVDVAAALRDMPTSAFIDWMHTSEAGNERVGRALYEVIRTPARPK
jgi:lysophospholipase L1-like esterase